MHWMQFVVELLDRLVWPLIVVICFIGLKKPLARLIPHAKKVKFKDVELEFGQELAVVSKNVEGAFPGSKKDRKSLLLKQACSSPKEAVLQAWTAVDAAAEALLLSSNHALDLNVSHRYKLIEQTLVKNNHVDGAQAKIFSDLRQLRNKVAHATGFQVGQSEAVQYVELCFKLVDYFTASIAVTSSTQNR